MSHVIITLQKESLQRDFGVSTVWPMATLEYSYQKKALTQKITNQLKRYFLLPILWVFATCISQDITEKRTSSDILTSNSRNLHWLRKLRLNCLTSVFLCLPAHAETTNFSLTNSTNAPSSSVIRFGLAGEPRGIVRLNQTPRSSRVSIGADLSNAATIPAIRQVAARYQTSRAVRSLNLSPKQWTAFFQAMVRVESAYNPTAQSHVGAYGLAQLMPATARELGVDPRDMMQNLDGGARYILQQMEAFGSLELALAAYNAGPHRVEQYSGVPPFTETRNHIAKVMAHYERILATL